MLRKKNKAYRIECCRNNLAGLLALLLLGVFLATAYFQPVFPGSIVYSVLEEADEDPETASEYLYESVQFPLTFNPSKEPETFEENGTSDSYDEESGDFPETLTYPDQIYLNRKKVAFVRWDLSHFNRPGVSLFILYHCWKSFLV